MRRINESLVDIEDCAGVTSTPAVNNHVLPKALRKCKQRASGDSVIPGAQTIYVKTWGCSHNNSDGEYMIGQLSAYGYFITESPLDAELWLLNSCTVKGPSEDSFINAVRSGRKLNKKIVVAGCVPQGQHNHRDLDGLSVVGVQQIDRVVEVVEETLKGNRVQLLSQKRGGIKGVSLSLPKIRRNKLIEIIPINSGCLNQCTYCKTKHARGDLCSYSPEEIVFRAKQVFQEGVKEIWLTSEDTGTYGRDIGSSLPQLLWELVKVIPDDCMLRIGMTNPPYILEHLQDIAAILLHPRVYSFLHVPVQSGSDAVLSDMKREYSVADFCNVVDYLMSHVPGVTIATDIICGFPTETVEDFELTLELVDRYKFPSLFINQFYPRPGTPAARMRRIPTQEVKRRSRQLTKLFHSYHPYQHKLGEKEQVLITEESTDGLHYVGHNKFYDQVLINKSFGNDLMGKMVTIMVTDTDKHYVKATPHKVSSFFFINSKLMLTIVMVMLLLAFLYVAIL